MPKTVIHLKYDNCVKFYIIFWRDQDKGEILSSWPIFVNCLKIATTPWYYFIKYWPHKDFLYENMASSGHLVTEWLLPAKKLQRTQFEGFIGSLHSLLCIVNNLLKSFLFVFNNDIIVKPEFFTNKLRAKWDQILGHSTIFRNRLLFFDRWKNL